MLPVGSTVDEHGIERPKAVSEFLVERMLCAGADRICFVLSPDKTDILTYYSDTRPRGASAMWSRSDRRCATRCSAACRSCARTKRSSLDCPTPSGFRWMAIGRSGAAQLAFLLFAVDRPEQFDAVVTVGESVLEIQVKQREPTTQWVWGAFRMPGASSASCTLSGANRAVATNTSAPWFTNTCAAVAALVASAPVTLLRRRNRGGLSRDNRRLARTLG